MPKKTSQQVRWSGFITPLWEWAEQIYLLRYVGDMPEDSSVGIGYRHAVRSDHHRLVERP